MSAAFDPASVRALLFDLDGTLIDSKEDIVASANFLRASRGLAPLSHDVISSFIGDGVDALVARLMGPDFQAQLPDLAAEFRAHYHDHCVVHTAFYPGVKATLEALAARGYKMAVVTNKPEGISQRILELLGAGPCFGAVIGGNSCAHKKPHPEPLQEACRRLGVELKHACMIGDSRVDVEAGHNAGVPALGVLGGGIADVELMRKALPTQVLEAFADLAALFKGHP
jgi:phosphoglycolate phosphatase